MACIAIVQQRRVSGNVAVFVVVLSLLFGAGCNGGNDDSDAIKEESLESTTTPLATYPILLFNEEFDLSTEPSDLGFVDTSFWQLSNGHLTSIGTGAANQPATVTTRAFAANRSAGAIAVDWSLRFPTEYGPQWRKRNIVSVLLLDAERAPLYEIVFKPRRPDDPAYASDIILRRWHHDKVVVLDEASTKKPTPHGPQAPYLRFRLLLNPDGTMTVFYSQGGAILTPYLKTYDDTHEAFTRLQIKYQTGVGVEEYHVDVDNLRVSATAGKFLVVIAKVLVENPEVKAALQVYRQDLNRAGWKSEVLIVEPSSDSARSAVALKKAIMQRYRRGCAGFVIVGSDPAIPTVYWRYHRMGPDKYPTDLFYADADQWVDMDHDGVYENFDSIIDSTGAWVADESRPVNPDNPRFYPEMFFGRIAALPIVNSLADEAAKVVLYLKKVHQYRTGALRLSDEQDNRAFIWGEDNYQGKNQVQRISPMAPNIVGFYNRVVTTPERFAQELEAGYRFVTLLTHSNPSGHSFPVYRGHVSTTEVFDLNWLNRLDTKVSYLNLFACSASNFIVANFAATYIFNQRFTLNVTGSTGDWGFLPDAVYYQDLITGVPIGIALKDYALRTQVDKEVGWPKGILHGDPLLTYTKSVPNKAASLSSELFSLYGRLGEEFTFTFSTQDLEGDQAVITLDGLPDGATFDGITLRFTPSEAQQGQVYALTATVTEPDLPGVYREPFTLEVAPPPSLGQVRNSGFEDGLEAPAFWSKDAFLPNDVVYAWGTGLGQEGSRGVSIRNDIGNDSRWLQLVEGLKPGQNYKLVGWLKAQDVVSGSDNQGANIGLYGTWDHVGAVGSFDWTRFEVPFVAPDNGQVTVACRLGFWSNLTTGQMWCDDFSLEEVP